MNESMTLSVVIPVYDEHATILELLKGSSILYLRGLHLYFWPVH